MKFNTEVSVGNIILLIGFIATMIVSIFGGWNKISDHEIRLTAVERRLDELNRNQVEYQTEMRTTVAHAIDMLTDVRLRIAQMPIAATPSHAR